MKTKLLTSCLSLSILLNSCSSAVLPVRPAVYPEMNPTAISTKVLPNHPSHVPTKLGGMLIEPYQDVRSKNLSSLYESLGESLIETLWFDQSTIWSTEDEPIAQNILKLGMNPGMGIRDLQAEGITGKGVTVAVIDQPLDSGHPEFEGRIVNYFDLGLNFPNDMVSMHGPAVISLLAGNSIGTAPDVKIYYVAVPSWLLDAQYYADALDWIIAENKKLPSESKIRVVSVSAAPSGLWSPFTENNIAWDGALHRAAEAGILVLDCTLEYGITLPCHYDLKDPDNLASCIPDWSGPKDSPFERIFIPTSRRTTATEGTEEAVYSYQYTGQGGLSWSVPYLTGVLALGWQINPNLTSSQLLEILYDSAYKAYDSASTIDPKAFIDRIRHTTGE